MTAARRDLADLPYWPLGLSLEQAAAMLGVSEDLFSRTCPVIPVRLGSRKLYDRDKVAAWFKTLDGSVDASRPAKAALPPRRNAMEMLDAAFEKERRPPQARRRHG